MDQEETPRIFESNGRRQGPTGECSSRLAIIQMVTEKPTFVCKLAPLKQIGYSCRLNGTLLPFLHWDVVSLLGCLEIKTLPPGAPLAEKLQLSVFLPNDLSLDDWYAGSTPCQRCGLMFPCWVLTIYAKQSCWSSPEEVWCPEHVGRPRPSMAALKEPAWDQRAGLVFAHWARRAAFYKEVE